MVFLRRKAQAVLAKPTQAPAKLTPGADVFPRDFKTLALTMRCPPPLLRSLFVHLSLAWSP